MNNQKEVLPLRIIAARFISSDETVGLDELNRITTDVYRLIQLKCWLWWTAFTVVLFCTVVTLLPGIVMSLRGNKAGELLAAIGLIPFFLLLAVFAYWRILQYGSMTATEPQKGIYADPDDPAVRNLERLFALLQIESTPRAFYVTRNGIRRTLDERYFFGSLRAAYVAKDKRIKDTLFAPIGFWFSREIFMEVDVEALIAQAKAKPNRAGAKRTYDYTDAVMSLIEHPAIRRIDPRKHGSKTKIVALLRDWYVGKRQAPPSDGQLGEYASMIQDVIAKNRSADS